VDATGRPVCPKCKSANKPASIHCRACGTPIEVRNAAHPGSLVAANGQRIGILAGFWVRLAAYTVDTLVLLFLAGFVTFYFFPDAAAAKASIDPEQLLLQMKAQFIADVVILFYFVVGWSAFGTTLGKRVLKLYVVRPDGSVPSAGRALIRQLMTLPSFLLLGIGYLMIGMRPDKRALHDLFADTYVVIKAP